MCGITGVVHADRSKPVALPLITAMCEVMVHRGPDEGGYHVRGHVGLGVRRLRVIDLETGQQPMFSEDGNVVLVFNGEIYNYLELRETLEQRGHRFRTRSDTEVLLRLYEDRGVECLREIDGMFAFAIWDENRQTLFLARDRLGEKPLHYHHGHGIFAFSSEIKSILCSPEVDREMDRESAYLYFFRHCVPAPRTIYKSVKKLLPAHYLTYRNGVVETKRYWHLSYAPNHAATEDAIAEGLRNVLTKALRRRMIADVPLGAFLSGGIDSSVVVGLMSSLAERPIKTFSIGFREDGFNELGYARIVARRFNTEHHEFVVEPRATDLAEKISWYFDEPFGGPSAIPTFIVSELARRHVTVAITGEGGDELFAGYTRHLVASRRRHLQRIPKWIRKLAAEKVARRLPDGMRGKRFLETLCLDEWFMGTLSESWKRSIFDEAFLREAGRVSIADSFEKDLEAAGDGHLSKYLYLDTKNYLPDDILVKVDRASMANSLEVRTLFLGHEIVEYAAGIPSRYKIRGGTSKYILKRSMRDLIPAEILARGKWGFALPLATWFRNELKDMIGAMVHAPSPDGVFDYAYLRRILDEHLTGRRDHHKLLWSFMMFRLWEQRWSRWRPSVRPPETAWSDARS